MPRSIATCSTPRSLRPGRRVAWRSVDSRGTILIVASGLHPLSALVLVVGLAGGAVLVGLLAVTARRLLGLHVGPFRTLIAGAIGYVVASLVSAAISPPRQAHGRVAPTPALIPVLIGI
jgi:hypothetical protein